MSESSKHYFQVLTCRSTDFKLYQELINLIKDKSHPRTQPP